MKFDEWEPVYETLLDDFGFDRDADERARDRLAAQTTPFDLDRLAHVRESAVAIVGASPLLESDDAIERADAADLVFAASSAATVLESNDVRVDCMVTDADKDREARTVQELTERGTPVALHAHGDNVAEIGSILDRCTEPSILPTTQAKPRGPVRNFGGFTDGDRAAFLADSLGASELSFIGWDFDDSTVDDVKAKKLTWAERLLFWLEYRRGDKFTVLDGRREAIDTSGIPID